MSSLVLFRMLLPKSCEPDVCPFLFCVHAVAVPSAMSFLHLSILCACCHCTISYVLLASFYSVCMLSLYHQLCPSCIFLFCVHAVTVPSAMSFLHLSILCACCHCTISYVLLASFYSVCMLSLYHQLCPSCIFLFCVHAVTVPSAMSFLHLSILSACCRCTISYVLLASFYSVCMLSLYHQLCPSCIFLFCLHAVTVPSAMSFLHLSILCACCHCTISYVLLASFS